MGVNLKEFIDYKSECPLCKKKLSLTFKGKNKKSIIFEEDRVVIKKDMYTINKHRHYSFAYSINMYDNTFYVDFFNSRDEILKNSIPVSYIQNYNKYTKSKTAIFYKFCSYCACYCYSSNYFNVNMKESRLEDFFIKSEYVATFRKINDSYKVYKITNQYDKNNCIIDYFTTNTTEKDLKFKIKWDCYLDSNIMLLPIQDFSNLDNLVNRLDKLIYYI